MATVRQPGVPTLGPAAGQPVRRRNDKVITEIKQFEGPHLLPAWPGWEEVADYTLDWALEHAALPSRR